MVAILFLVLLHQMGVELREEQPLLQMMVDLVVVQVEMQMKLLQVKVQLVKVLMVEMDLLEQVPLQMKAEEVVEELELSEEMHLNIQVGQVEQV